MSGRRVLRGTVWTVAGYAAVQVFRFGFNIALAQMVAPQALGTMALVGLFIQGLAMFSDLGIRQCVVQHARGDDPAFLNTAWTVQVLCGAALWAGSALLAWPMAAFYGEPALLWLVPLAGLAGLVGGFASPALWTYTREVRRGPLVRREVGVYVAAYAAVLAALSAVRARWPGGEARDLELAIIALGAVAAALGEVALSYTLRPVARPRVAWEPAARRELLHFGSWVFVSSTCTFFAAQADRLAVGKLSLETLGVYHIAVVIAALPAGVLAALGAQLVFPLVSGAMRDGEPLGAVFPRAHRAMVAAAALLITGMACVGPAAVRLLYNDQYAEAAAYIRLLAVPAWITALLVPGELTVLALGHTRTLALAQAVRLACVPVFLFAGFELAGLPGLILGVAAAEAVRYAVIAAALHRAGVTAVLEDAGVTLLAAALFGLYVLAEGAVGAAGGRVALPLAAGVVLTAVWAAVYAAWAAPAEGTEP
ncbi:oligosaccharide flippase family protein [Gemmata sp.]|uniref:oligosaccharide flippase family protein n=1 Tax=Gemmata sp. TaxID=1914242 RepID=UPI003F72BFB7